MGTAISDTDVTFVGNHPVEQIYIKGDLGVGYKIDKKVKLHAIDGDPDHVYFYANNRAWIVDKTSGEIVYSPGYVVPDRAVAYVKAHPSTSVKISGGLQPGLKLDSNVEITAVPDVSGYGYVYVDNRPALVDTGSRTIVWVE
jgi:hypothetical protein